MRSWRFSVVALLTAGLGVGVVAGVESAIDAIDIGSPPTVSLGRTYDPDASRVRYTLSRKIDVRLNGVGLDSPERLVIRRLGKPASIDSDDLSVDIDVEKFRDFVYDGLLIGTRGRGGEMAVDMIEIDSDRWKINGVGIGSSIQDVKGAFGLSAIETSETIGYYLHSRRATTWSPEMVIFTVSDGVVIRIRAGGRC